MIIIISEEDFLNFERVRKKGLTNMRNLKNVSWYSGLTEERVLKIMKDYKELSLKFNEGLK